MSMYTTRLPAHADRAQYISRAFVGVSVLGEAPGGCHPTPPVAQGRLGLIGRIRRPRARPDQARPGLASGPDRGPFPPIQVFLFPPTSPGRLPPPLPNWPGLFFFYQTLRQRLTRGHPTPIPILVSRPDGRPAPMPKGGRGGKSGLHGRTVPDNVRRDRPSGPVSGTVPQRTDRHGRVA